MEDGVAYYGSLRRFFENEWYVPVSEFGIGYWEFWDMNPRIIAVRSLAYEREMIRRDREMWQQGLYVYEAFGVVLGNAFRKKGTSPQKYREKPLMDDQRVLLEDPERNERLAMIEMDRYIAALSKQGMQTSKLDAVKTKTRENDNGGKHD